jgi:hypothetical protein
MQSGVEDFWVYVERDLSLSQKEYSELKLALCFAGYPDWEAKYHALPLHLKAHEVGNLMWLYIETGERENLDKAAALMTNHSSNPWLFLAK